MRVLVLFNPISGAGRAAAAGENIAAALRRVGHEAAIAHTRKIDSQGEVDWLDRLLKDFQLLVVCGGDGAVRMTIAAAARTKTPIYHLPYGTENLFALEFGMDREPSTLLSAIDKWNVQYADMGLANGEPFALMASIGFDSEVVHELAIRRGASISHFSYLGPIWTQLWRWRPSHLMITVDGQRIDGGQPGMSFIANCKQYGWRFNPAARASMFDGEFDVAFFPTRSRLDMIGWAVKCLRQTHLDDPRLVYRRGRRVEVRCPDTCRYQLDGDPTGARKVGEECPLLTAEIQPAALPILVP